MRDTVLTRAPQNREEIAKVLVFLHGSKARAALHYGLTPGVLDNILFGRTRIESHIEAIEEIERDTGAERSAWEK
jgi:hypothetical protein